MTQQQGSLLQPDDDERALVLIVQSGSMAFADVARALVRLQKDRGATRLQFERWLRAAVEDGATVADLLVQLRQPVPKKAPQASPREHRVRAILTEFDAAWQARYRQPYLRTSAGAEARAAKLIAQEPPASVTGWIRAYLASPKPFYAESRHSFLLFVRSINEWRVRQADDRPSASVPDAQETSRYLRDLRKGRAS